MVVLPQSRGKFKPIPLAKHGSLLGSLAIRIHMVPTRNVLLGVLQSSTQIPVSHSFQSPDILQLSGITVVSGT